MKKVTLPLAAIALVGLYAGTASAQCDFNIANAKGVKGSMVRNYAACPSTQNPVSNTNTEGESDACQPVAVQEFEGDETPYLFSAKGKCDVSTKAKLESDCAKVKGEDGSPLGLDAGPCHITYVSAKCGGITRGDGVTLIDGVTDAGWTLATLTRATLNDPIGGDMTVFDFPVTFQFSTPSKGKISFKSNSSEALIPLLTSISTTDLPPCTQLQVVELTIKAPGNLPFAKLGTATLPKE